MSAQPMTPEVRSGVRKWLLQAALGSVAYATVFFLSAGTLHWFWGWVMMAVITLVLIAQPLLLIPINPALLAERQKGTRDQGVKRWDKVITSLLGTAMFLVWIVAGLDYRWGWTGPVPLWVHLGGLLFVLLGYALFLWAMVSNAFFSEGVRIQTERGHTVVTGGPYRFVRHPGYVGVIVTHLAMPFLLGSWWALLPATAVALLSLRRTALEDRTLLAELPGYAAYAAQTPYRLLPRVW
jgi:protein-S-isoprenylcysteine O-methyltransferase Ste14